MKTTVLRWIGCLVLVGKCLLASASPFFDAVRSGESKNLERLLSDPNADVNAPDERGFTPLIYATWLHSVREMQLLLAEGADPNYRTKDQVTAFHFATDDPAKARLLLDHGLKVNPSFVRGYTPLLLAARHPRGYEVTKLLL